MDNEHKEISVALYNASMLPGTFDKRFSKSVYYMAISETEQELTEKQVIWLYKLLYKYRRQCATEFNKYYNNYKLNHHTNQSNDHLNK